MGQNLKSKMKLSIILVFLTFALTIDAAGPPGLYLKPIDGRQELEQTRGDEESLATDRRGKRTYHLKQHGSKPLQKTRANEGNDLEVMRWEMDCLMCTSGCPGWCNPDSDE